MEPQEFVRHGSLLIPSAAIASEQTATLTEVVRTEVAAIRELTVEHRTARPADRALPQPADVGSDGAAERLRQQFVATQNLTAVRNDDEWTRRAQQIQHNINMADLEEQAAAAERARRERAHDAADADALGALYRRASASGARARIRAEIMGSAEMRALRIASVRKVALIAGLPVLAAFAAWSTTGAQAGVVSLLHLPEGSAAWWASWAVEPALITIVALLIIGRAILRSSGGNTDWKAGFAEWTALSLSLALNIIGGWHGGTEGLAGALPHAIGPLGCAGTAALIGLFDGYVTVARPWDGAPRLADLNLVGPVPAPVAVPTPTLRSIPGGGTGSQPVAAAPAGTGAQRTGRSSVGTRTVAAPSGRGGTGPGRAAVPAANGGSRRAISASTGVAGTGRPDTAKEAARAHWDKEVAVGRVPNGTELARAAGRDNDDNGQFRRYAREWGAERPSTGTGS